MFAAVESRERGSRAVVNPLLPRPRVRVLAPPRRGQPPTARRAHSRARERICGTEIKQGTRVLAGAPRALSAAGRRPSTRRPEHRTHRASLACSAEAGTSSTEPAGGCAVSQGPPGGVRATAARAPDRVAEDLAARGRVERHPRARAGTRRTSTHTVATSPVHARRKDKFGPMSVRVA